MSRRIEVELSVASINAAIKELKAIEKTIPAKTAELCKRLAEMGAESMRIGYENARYDGRKDISVSVKEAEGGYDIVADGESVLFVEFGTGVRYGGGHPEAGKYGMGPGTYPDGKGHWDDPKGWWIPKSEGGGHTYGNHPSMTMYHTANDLRRAILRVAKEVFGSD